MTESHECLLAFCPRWTAYAVQYFAPGLKTCEEKKKRVSDFHRPLRLGGDAALVTKKNRPHIYCTVCFRVKLGQPPGR